MPAQPAPREPEEEMEVEGEPEVPEANGVLDEERENSYLSEMDDEDCERRRLECLHEMSDLEKQFLELKDKLFRERLSQVKMKLDEVIAGRAAEYKEPLAVLHKNMQLPCGSTRGVTLC
uniref:BRMS1 transcriptional repressor and anoikis regulator n=1 Tax=Scleropages formosus TaxID=113540 RepID=A0A8C9T0X7_SCLFO